MLETLRYQDLADLLFDIIPKFTAAAHTRFRLDRDPRSFFLQFESILDELKYLVLDSRESDWDTLSRIASLLEELVYIGQFTSPHHRYPRLHSLLHDAPNSVETITFEEDKGWQGRIIKRLADCRRELELDRGPKKIEAFIDIQHDLPEQLLHHTKKLYNALDIYWPCTCNGVSHPVNLNLGTFMTPGPEIANGCLKYNLLFPHQKGEFDHPQWLEGEVTIHASGTRFVDTAEDKFTKPIQVNACKEHSAGLPTQTTLCRLVNRCHRSKFRVKMIFKDEVLLADLKPGVSKMKVNTKFLNLEAMSSELRQASTREINELSLILAYSLLHLYDEHNALWLTTSWIRSGERWRTPEWTNYVRFFRTQPHAIVNITSPYLPAHPDEYVVDEPFEDFEEVLEDAQHGAPCLLALGSTLLQIRRLHLGIEDVEPEDEPNVNTNLSMAQNLHDKLKDNDHLNHWFSEAVEACISESQIGDINMKDYIYNKIVYPLELNLNFYSPLVDQLQTHLSKDCTKTLRQLEEAEVCLYGGVKDVINHDKKFEAETWQKMYSSVVKRISDGRPPNSSRVKIAILDTGISLLGSQPDIVNKRGDMMYKSFLEGDSDNVQKDNVGHGTHLAGTLASIAPQATIYIARVFAKREPSVTKEADGVAKAIDWAIKNEVDIIVMSFGFVEEQSAILKAIGRAYAKGITMFAAASNDGANREDNISWPAKIQEVICVHSGSGGGTKSRFTPWASDNHRVMVLGECVKSLGTYMSGTSCATPIAAGIAACILDYARRVGLSEDEILKLRRTEYMRKMFKIMKKEEREDYWWIMPWSFFNDKRSDPWIADQMRIAIR